MMRNKESNRVTRISFYWGGEVEELSSSLSSERQEFGPFVVPSGLGYALSNSNQRSSFVSCSSWTVLISSLCTLQSRKIYSFR
jgi:hypothetical protein